MLNSISLTSSALIAEFMAEKKELPHYLFCWLTSEYKTGWYTIDRMQFHLSWDWLMPVVDKIMRTKIGDGLETFDYPNFRTFGMINEETGGIMVGLNGFQVFEAETLIEATFLAVVDFLEYWSKADRYLRYCRVASI